MKKKDRMPEWIFAILIYPILFGNVVWSIFDATFFDSFQRKLLMDDLRKFFSFRLFRGNPQRR